MFATLRADPPCGWFRTGRLLSGNAAVADPERAGPFRHAQQGRPIKLRKTGIRTGAMSPETDRPVDCQKSRQTRPKMLNQVSAPVRISDVRISRELHESE